MMKIFHWIKDNPTLAILALLALSVMIIAFVSLWRFTGFSTFNHNTGAIGDTFGIMNPFIAISAALITFAAFWVQYQANQTMLNENRKQQIITRFYEMLKIHRDNVKDFEWLQNVYSSKDSKSIYQKTPNEELIEKNGRQIFDYYLIEFNLIYDILDIVSPHLKKKEKIRRAYNIFFFGGSDEYLNYDMRNDLYISLAETEKDFFISKVKSIFANYENSPKKERIIQTLFRHRKFFLSQAPFYGHFDILGNYYRHLFLIVKTVATEDEKYLSYDEKRNLLRILRAQLSNKEQIMLFYNWFSGCGSQWEENNDEGNHFFTKYRMIHNIIPHLMAPFLELEEDYSRAYTRFVRCFSHCKYIQDFGTNNDPIFEFEDDESVSKFEYRY